MHALVSKAVFPLIALVWVSGAQAATVAGTVSATLVLTSSCQVNGAAATGGMSFGNLNFGTANSLFTEADGQVLGGGGGALSILCSAGTTPTLTVSAGANDGKSTGARAHCMTASPITCPTICIPTVAIRICWQSVG